MATRRRSTSNTITGTVSDLQRRVQYLQNVPRPTRLANQVVTRNAIQPRAVGSDQIALNAITNDQIAADAIERENIAAGAVSTGQLNNGAVTNEKLGPFAVDNDKLADAAVASRNMTPNSVENASLQNGSVNFRTVAVDAIGKQNMQNNSVGTNELENGSVNNSKLGSGSVGQSNLQSNSVGFGQMQGGAVGTSTLQTGAVTRSKIGSGQVGTTQIENRAVTGLKIAQGTVTTTNMNEGTMQGIARRVGGGAGIRREITNAGSRLSALFGTASQQVARGNHTHGTGGASSWVRVVFPVGPAGGYDLALRGHTHTVNATSSSVKYKKNITRYSLENPQKLLELSLVKYKYKNSKRINHEIVGREWVYGYLAEEVKDLGLGEVVTFDRDGDVDGIQYDMLSIYVIELLKQQQGQIESLQEELRRLRSDNGN